MIHFIPKLLEHGGSISDGEKILSNQVNKNLSSRMTEMFKDKYCTIHPDFENSLIVNFQEGQPIAIVESFCCESFKEKLDMIAQNKNPFKND